MLFCNSLMRNGNKIQHFAGLLGAARELLGGNVLSKRKAWPNEDPATCEDAGRVHLAPKLLGEKVPSKRGLGQSGPCGKGTDHHRMHAGTLARATPAPPEVEASYQRVLRTHHAGVLYP